jgi:hypothetical protein
MNNLGQEIPWRNVRIGDQVLFVSLTAAPYVDTIYDIWQTPADCVFMNMKYFFQDEPFYNKMFHVPPADVLNAAVHEWNVAQASFAEEEAEAINIRNTATHIGALDIGLSNNQIEPLTHGEFEYNTDYVRVNGNNHLIYNIDALEAHYNSGSPSAHLDPLTRAEIVLFEIFTYIRN